MEVKGLFPKIEDLSKSTIQFKPEFGLDKLPEQPGVILVRGARQFGKSTWLELCLRENALLGKDTPEEMAYWGNENHEVDFIFEGRFIEAKISSRQPSEFSWSPNTFPNKTLEVVCINHERPFNLGYCKSISVESFLG